MMKALTHNIQQEREDQRDRSAQLFMWFRPALYVVYRRLHAPRRRHWRVPPPAGV